MRIKGIYEAHVGVTDLNRSIKFYEDVVGLTLSARFNERSVAFMSVGGLETGMLGLWAGTSPAGTSVLKPGSHFAFTCDKEDVIAAPDVLRSHGIQPLDLFGNKTDEAIVVSWMPALAVYFRDPDENLLEYICPKIGAPRDIGIVPWSQWNAKNEP